MELIEPEVVPVPKRMRKKKPTLEEQFKDIPTRTVVADTLSEEEKMFLVRNCDVSHRY